MHLYVTFSLLVILLLRIGSATTDNRILPHKINTQLYTKECEIIIYVKDPKYIDAAKGISFIVFGKLISLIIKIKQATIPRYTIMKRCSCE